VCRVANGRSHIYIVGSRHHLAISVCRCCLAAAAAAAAARRLHISAVTQAAIRAFDELQSPRTMDNEVLTQQCTQDLIDPRRMGRNNSGLSDADISDVMCILHPCSPAAFRIVALTGKQSPQHVLQRDGYRDYNDGLTQSVLEEQETFILNSDGPNHALDLALRLTAEIINPAVGFVFGRNSQVCDIVLASDTNKRVSNLHFSIFMNDAGVLMLRDFSTNGTMVDDMLLKGKNRHDPQTRMLESGSIIQILSPQADEVVKFVVRIPSRDGHFQQYESKFQFYMRRAALADGLQARPNDIQKRLAVAQPRTQSLKAPVVHKQYAMHWNGGDKYNIIGLIGKGAFATVYQLATKSEGRIFAAKELEKRKFMKNGILDRKLDNEMQIMQAICHPNIVQYVDYVDHANHLYIIMEFVPCGDLQQYLNLNGPLKEPVAKRMASQVLDSLTYLHKKMITHRDIKPDNILLANIDSDNFTIKLSDFGLSKVVKDNDTFLKTFCGTLLYCAPEVFPHYDAHVAGRGQKRPRKSSGQQPTKFHSYSQSVDIWSFGAVLWYALCQKPPFEGVNDPTGRGMFEKIMMTPLDPTDLVKQGISDDAVALLAEMLNTDPASRPSPSYCLRHRWLVTAQQVAPGPVSPEHGLLAIAEEEEAEPGEAPNVAGLRIDDQGGENSQDSSQYDEASIHSGSMNFFDPRQSKRFKSDAFAYREQDELVDSSPELFHQSIPIILQPDEENPQNRRPGQRKLFGEISQSALNNEAFHLNADEQAGSGPGTNGISRANQRSDHDSQQAQDVAARGAVASPSLQGAESLLREVRMDSEGTDSPVAEPTTPNSSKDADAGESSKEKSDAHNDATPKALQPRSFDRQINIPIPAAYWYDPQDESTHNLEYASKASGHDYMTNPSFIATTTTSLPTRFNRSGPPTQDDQHDDTDVEPDVPGLVQASPSFLKPAPRLGRLVSTPDSFASITLNLTNKVSTWGRAPSNTHVYPDRNDTRIPKRGIIIVFHAEGIENYSETGDWTKLPDLHCFLSTESNNIQINGVPLRRGAADKMNGGRVYTGDVITVCSPGTQGTLGLKFKCEFFHGEGKEWRPPGQPRFKLEADRPEKSNKGGNESSAKAEPNAD